MIRWLSTMATIWTRSSSPCWAMTAPMPMLAAMADNIESYAKEALLYQAVAEAMDLAPTQEQIDTYSAYTEAYGANYCTMIALMDTVTDALTTGAQVK